MGVPILNANVAIIGEPKVLKLSVTLLLKCRCGQKTLLQGTPNSAEPMGKCDDCGTVYIVHGVYIEPRKGILGVPMGFGRALDAGDPPTGDQQKPITES